MAEQPNLRKEERDEEERCEGCGRSWPSAFTTIFFWAMLFALVAYLASIDAL